MNKKFLMRVISIVMAVILTVLPAAKISADTQVHYIKDIKFVIADKKKDAEKKLNEQGYVLIDNNLNEGTGEKGVYMGILLTTDSTEAITDIKLMNMKGSYTLEDYGEELKNTSSAVVYQAKMFADAVKEFKVNYKAGLESAKAAYQGLNFLYVDEAEMSLGDYLLSDEPDEAFYIKMLLICHKDILNLIMQQMAMAVQEDADKSWIDRMTQTGSSFVPETNDMKLEYQTVAEKIYPVLNDMALCYLISLDKQQKESKQEAEKQEEVAQNNNGTPQDEVQDAEGDKVINDEVYSEEAVDKIQLDEFMSGTASGNDYESLKDMLEEGNIQHVVNENEEEVTESSSIEEQYNINIDEIIDSTSYSDSMRDMYNLVFAILDIHEYDQGTLKDYFLSFVEDDFDVYSMMYTLVDSLTPGQRAMISMAGPYMIITGAGQDMSIYESYYEDYESCTENISGASIWEGVDLDVYENEIGITDAATRAMQDKNEWDEITSDADTLTDDLLMTIQWITCISSAIGAAAGIASLAATGIVAVATSASMLGMLGTGFGVALYLTLASSILGALGLVALVVTVCLLITIGIIKLVNWLQGPDYTKIPKYIYDVTSSENKGSSYVQYKCVEDLNEKCVDLNDFEAEEWVALYVSYEAEAGAPIRSDIKVQKADGTTPNGYNPVCIFGSNRAENLNKYDYDDDVNGIYLFFSKDDNALKCPEKEKYISDIQLMTGKNEGECTMKLEKANYQILNVNLTPSKDKCTFIGYKLTTLESEALRDIRVDIDNHGSVLHFGNVIYTNHGTGNGLSLYTTKVVSAGTPIKDSLIVTNDMNSAPAGYEPVNTFTGGVPINFDSIEGFAIGAVDKTKSYYLYFLPKEAYTEGTKYISGIQAYFVSCPRDSEISMEGRQVLYEFLNITEDEMSAKGLITYSYTYNPYRALYGIKGLGDYSDVTTVSYDNNGYLKIDQYVGISQSDSKSGTVATVMIRMGSTASGLFGNVDLGTSLWVTGKGTYTNSSGNVAEAKPLTVDDIIFSNEILKEVPKGYTAVSDMWGDALNPKKFGEIDSKISSEFYIYYKGVNPAEGKYVGEIFIADKNDLRQEYKALSNPVDLDCDDIDKTLIFSSLTSLGATRVFDKDINTGHSNGNAAYIGVSMASKKKYAYTDLMLYCYKSSEKPPEKVVKDGCSYTLISSVNIFCDQDGQNKNCDRIYLYGTKMSSAGDRIIDFMISDEPIVDGWDLVKTYNDTIIYEDKDISIDSENHWYLQVKRYEESSTKEVYPYIEEIITVNAGSRGEAIRKLAAAGCNDYLDWDLNKSAGGYYIYMGYKRTDNEKEAITDIVTAHTKNKPDTQTVSGFTYNILSSKLDLNKGAGGDYIYMYYTKDSRAGTPITDFEMYTSKDKTSFSTDTHIYTTLKRTDGNASDLNAGTWFGPNLYLSIEREADDYSFAGSFIGNGSVLFVVFGAVMCMAGVTVMVFYKKKSKNKGIIKN